MKESMLVQPSEAALPFLGVWRLTKVESSHPFLPHPVSGLVILTQEDHGIHYTNDATWSDGRNAQVSIVFRIDGEWHPAVGSLISDSVCGHLRSDGTLVVQMRKGGSDSGMLRATVSPDMNKLLSHWEVIYPGGIVVTWDATSERQ